MCSRQPDTHGAVEVVGAHNPTLTGAMNTAATKAFVLLDRTPLPIDRIAVERPLHFGDHTKRGVKARPPRSRPRHQGRAFRGMIDALEEARRGVLGGKEYRGADGTVRVPYLGRWGRLRSRGRLIAAAAL